MQISSLNYVGICTGTHMCINRGRRSMTFNGGSKGSNAVVFTKVPKNGTKTIYSSVLHENKATFIYKGLVCITC